MNKIDPRLNPLEVLIVAEQLKNMRVAQYTLSPGNQCIWAYWGASSCPINAYFIFRDGLLVDTQFD